MNDEQIEKLTQEHLERRVRRQRHPSLVIPAHQMGGRVWWARANREATQTPMTHNSPPDYRLPVTNRLPITQLSVTDYLFQAGHNSTHLHSSTIHLRSKVSGSQNKNLSRIQTLDGLTKPSFDRAMAFRRDDFAAFQFANVKGVDGSAFFSRNFSGGDVEVEFAEGLRDFVEQTDAIFGFDFDECPRFGGFVIETDLSGNSLAGVGVVSRTNQFLFQNHRMKINSLATQRAVENGFKFVALLGP